MVKKRQESKKIITDGAGQNPHHQLPSTRSTHPTYTLLPLKQLIKVSVRKYWKRKQTLVNTKEAAAALIGKTKVMTATRKKKKRRRETKKKTKVYRRGAWWWQ